MKIKLLLIAVSSSLVFSCGNDTKNTPESVQEINDTLAEKAVFRNIAWEMSPEQVKKYETGQLLQDTLTDSGDPMLVYGDRVMNEKANILYIFGKDNKIARTTITYETDILKDKEYVDKYFKILKNMIEKYGNPIKDNTKWLGSMFHPTDTLNYGKALLLGQVSFAHVWRNTIDAAIVLQMQNMNNSILLTTTYVPEKVAKELTDTRNQDEKKGF